MIPSQQVTVVFQGGINLARLGSGRDDGSDFLYNVARTRAALPNATIILSTWQTLTFPSTYNSAHKLDIDQLILSPDPGGLPNIKFGYDTPNNVNRQIISSQAGLNQVSSDYALKLRADSYLGNDSLLAAYTHYLEQVNYYAPDTSITTTEPPHNRHVHKANIDYAPIAVPNLFTIDPNVYEHMAYHMSDWAQFGEREILKRYWSARLMSKDDATYFEHHTQTTDAKFAENMFRTRLAVEQHITTQYAKQLGYEVPIQYNHITPSILQAHNDFLARHIIVLNMENYGLALPKYAWATQDEFMDVNCINQDDWYQLFHEHWQLYQPDTTRLTNAQMRAQRKQLSADSFKRTSPDAQDQLLTQLYP